MAYKFELTFKGLCVLTFEGADKRAPTAVNVLLAKTPPAMQHVPILSFNPRQLAAGSSAPFTIVPTPDGRHIGLLDLKSQMNLRLDPSGTGLTAIWRPTLPGPEPEAPPTDADQEWLNWSPALTSGHDNVPVPDESKLPFANLNAGKITAHLRLTRGTIKAGRVARRVSDNSFALWDFKRPDNTVKVRKAIAEVVILTLDGLNVPVWFQGYSWGFFGLVARPSDTVVQASVTNLPAVEVPSGAHPTPKLDHFAHFYDLFDPPPLPPAGLALPETGSDVITDTTSSVICPNATYTRTP